MSNPNLPLSYQIKSLDAGQFGDDPEAWIIRETKALSEMAWLLAFADDGVIWGKVEAGELALSTKAFPSVSPVLSADTFQLAYLFNKDMEIKAWKQDDNFFASVLRDAPANEGFAFDESYILWGTQVEKQNGGFSLVSDGRQGLMHAVPLIIDSSILVPDRLYRPLRLRMRHYVGFQKDHGQAAIVASRLAELTVERR